MGRGPGLGVCIGAPRFSARPCLDSKVISRDDRYRGWNHEVSMYWNHNVEKIVFYNTAQSNEPLMYNRAFYLRRVVHYTLKAKIKVGVSFLVKAGKLQEKQIISCTTRERFCPCVRRMVLSNILVVKRVFF